MAENALAKILCWVVVGWTIIGAVGTYRYFLTPVELRFGMFEAWWLASSFLGDLVVAVVLLLLLKKSHPASHNEK